jgi:hypothetical protein
VNIRYFFLSILFTLLTIPIIKGCDSTKSTNAKNYVYDSLRIEASTKYTKNILHKIILGKHYRKVWAAKTQLPIFVLDSVMGGLKPIKAGGGMQTISIHMKDSLGRRFVLRSVDKNPSSVLEPVYRTTIINTLVLDQISAENPYASILVAQLAEDAGIYHTNPQYFYLKEDARLLEFHHDLKNCMVMLEEKPHKSWKDSPVFDYPQKIINTQEMISRMISDPEIKLDQKLFLQSRLFDILINDWDRHAGQWSWLLKDEGQHKVFKPLPRDRDNALFLFDDGILPYLVSRWYGHPKFQSFHGYFEYVPGLLFNSRFIDPIFLNQLEPSDWENIINTVITRLPDSVILRAVNHWPKEIIALEGQKTAKKLIARRNQLKVAGLQFYKEMNQHLTIIGTDHKDHIVVERLKDSTRVTLKSDLNGIEYFNRTVSNKITKKISIYALDGDDQIVVKGKVNNGITINIIGGNGNDQIHDQSDVSGWMKKTIIYDTRTGNNIEFGVEGLNKTGTASQKMIFNRAGKKD